MLEIKRIKRGCYYSKSTSIVSLSEIRDMIKNGEHIKIINSEEDRDFLSMIWITETGYKNHLPRNSSYRSGDSKMLSRALRAGGMIEYIKHLEERITNETKAPLLQ